MGPVEKRSGSAITADPLYLTDLARNLSASGREAEGYRGELAAVLADLRAAGAAGAPGWGGLEREAQRVLRELAGTASELAALARETRLQADRVAEAESSLRLGEHWTSFARGLADAFRPPAGLPPITAAGLSLSDPAAWGRLTGAISASLSTFLAGTGLAVTRHAEGVVRRAARPGGAIPSLLSMVGNAEVFGARARDWGPAVLSLDTLRDARRALGDFGLGLARGVADPVASLVRLLPVHEDWTGEWRRLGSGLASRLTHPAELGRALLGLDDLEENGIAWWVGNLVPGTLATLASAGGAASLRGGSAAARVAENADDASRAARMLPGRATGPDPAGRIRLLRRPWIDGYLPPNILGATDAFGRITIRWGLPEDLFRETLRHESIHSLLSPTRGPLRTTRARLRMLGYHNSDLLRFLEEAIAEGYGARSVRQAIELPLTGPIYNIRVPRLLLEGVAATGGSGGAVWGAYAWAEERWG